MGAHWGLIFNQTKLRIIYILHQQERQKEDIVRKVQIGGKVVADIQGLSLNGQLSGKYENEFKETKVKNDSKYIIQSGRISTGGLQDVDFDVTKYISIFMQDGQQIKQIRRNCKIVCDADIRFRIALDFGVIHIKKQQAEKIKDFESNYTCSTSQCTFCHQKTRFKKIGKEQKCCHCKKKVQQGFLCSINFVAHFSCKECHEDIQRNKAVQGSIDKFFDK